MHCILRHISQRTLHVGLVRHSLNQTPLYKLRQRTGLAYNLCREALNKHDNNIDQAEAWLKAQALAHGLQKASKVTNRSTREGVICLSVCRDNKSVSVLELNCETDFVAKNQIFKDFSLELGTQLPDNLGKSSAITEHIGFVTCKPADSFFQDTEKQIAPLITKLGENIRLARALHYICSSDAGTRLFGQIHAQCGSREANDHTIMAGRFGAIVCLRSKSKLLNEESLRTHGNRLCRHVIGFSPSYIELPDNIRTHLMEAEKEKAEIQDEECDADGSGSDSERSHNQNNRDDWPSIMDQTLIMSEDTSVREFCNHNNFSIIHFDRLECGSDTP